MATYGSQVWGLAPINGVIEINSTNDTFSFDVDGTPFLITIPQGNYKTSRDLFISELVQPINDELESVNAPVFARIGGVHLDTHSNVLILEHSDKGSVHVIDNFGGSALATIYGETQFTRPPVV